MEIFQGLPLAHGQYIEVLWLISPGVPGIPLQLISIHVSALVLDLRSRWTPGRSPFRAHCKNCSSGFSSSIDPCRTKQTRCFSSQSRSSTYHHTVPLLVWQMWNQKAETVCGQLSLSHCSVTSWSTLSSLWRNFDSLFLPASLQFPERGRHFFLHSSFMAAATWLHKQPTPLLGRESYLSKKKKQLKEIYAHYKPVVDAS